MVKYFLKFTLYVVQLIAPKLCNYQLVSKSIFNLTFDRCLVVD